MTSLRVPGRHSGALAFNKAATATGSANATWHIESAAASGVESARMAPDPGLASGPGPPGLGREDCTNSRPDAGQTQLTR